MRFRSKPVEIDAILWTGENRTEVALFLSAHGLRTDPFVLSNVRVRSRRGYVDVCPGDWIIPEQGQLGMFYPCAPDVFDTKYEPVPDEPWFGGLRTIMRVCPQCGNKRCPLAHDPAALCMASGAR